MNSDVHKGELKRWNDEKGYGFISVYAGGKDVFVHISALKRMSRRPVVGDVIIFQIHSDSDGKRRAVNARIAGVMELRPRPPRQNINRRSAVRIEKRGTGPRLLSIVFIVALLVAASFVYNKLIAPIMRNKEAGGPVPAHGLKAKEQTYHCEGKRYCSQMSSCAEAKFYLRNCPGTKMDGDGDGIPCERQLCTW